MQLATLFSDYAVLQQGRPLPVWGWASAGAAVTVTLAGKTAQATADAAGRWRTTLPALPAGGPYELIAIGDGETLTAHEVLVGEVWVCSGQSNMEMSVAGSRDAVQELAASADPALRMFTVPQRPSLEPEESCEGSWVASAPHATGNFSAVGYFFARTLRQALGVPVGMINTSWGGTPAEAWTSREALTAEPELHSLLASIDSLRENTDALEHIKELVARWQAQSTLPMPPVTDAARAWAQPDTTDVAWPEMELPTSWHNAGVEHNGVLWFRKTVELPAAWAGQDLVLNIGAVDKSEITYFNGVEVGSLTVEQNPQAWCHPRRYLVPGHLVHVGRNMIAVRAFSNIYDAGLTGPAGAMRLEGPGAPAIPLAGTWRYQVELDLGNYRTPSPEVGGFQNASATLANGMIAPLVPYALAGAIWYQGESNADRAAQYRVLFPAMISDWRTRWQQGDFPFLFVQLANFMARDCEPEESDWAELREAQTRTLALPNTGMAVIIDIGEAEDIHPTNKQDVGYRLAQWALADSYGKAVETSGPLFASAAREGQALRVAFTHVDGGLVAKDGPLTGFAVAGADRRFAWADARIDGDTVVVSSPAVPDPVAVRYAWANNPACNLYNAAGLPASPFRSDQWNRHEKPVAAASAEA